MSTKRAPKPARGKTTPASNNGSFTTYAHGVPDVDLDGPPTAETSAETLRRKVLAHVSLYSDDILSPDSVKRAMHDLGRGTTDAFVLGTYEDILRERRASREERIASVLASYDAAEKTYQAALAEAEADGYEVSSSVYEAHDDALAAIAHDAIALLREQREADRTPPARAATDVIDPVTLRATLARSVEALEAFQDREACSEILDEIAEYGEYAGGFDKSQVAYLVIDQDGGETWVDVHDQNGDVLAREVVVTGWMRRGEVPEVMRPDLATMPASVGANLKYHRREFMVIDAAKVTAHDFEADLRVSAATAASGTGEC